jgi:hypothetical protein
MLEHLRQHTLAVLQNFVIPKPQDVKAVEFQSSRPHLIVIHTIEMLAAVQLYDQPRLKTYEIHDKSEHRKLSSKLMSRQLSST